MSLEKALLVARRAATRAGHLALRMQAAGVTAETKADQSPVTAADRAAERLIAAEIEAAFPGDGILGEEGADHAASSGYRWIVDPIDGTKDYVRGNPLWCVLIGRESLIEDRVVVGVAHFPALGRTYYAARGLGAYANDEPIRASAVTDPAQAVLCFNALHELRHYPFHPRVLTWMERFWNTRCLGGGADAMLVAAGQADVWVEPSAKPWDLAPVQVIVEEAGGRFFNLDGGNSVHGGNCVACAPGLEQEVKRFLAG
jgi:histidinol-phosphatase